MENKSYTITEDEYLDFNGKWITEFHFWRVDLSDINFEIDDRFCEVVGKRKQSKIIGNVNNIKFPVKYPFILNNGIILNKS